MKPIIIDCTFDHNGIPNGYQTIDADPAGPAIHSDPAGGVGKVTANAVLLFHSANVAAREASGFNVITSLPGVPAGTSRWQVILNAQANPASDPIIKGLGLKP